MAQYVEKVYASDVWQENRADGQSLGVVRGTSVKTSVKHSFSYDGYPWGIDAVQASFLGMEFPLSEKYGKKKLVAAKISAYVTDVSTSASGSFKSGKMIFGVDDYATDRFQSDATAAQLEAEELNEGAYNVLINWEDNLGGNLSKAAANGKMAAAPNVWAGCTGDMIVGNSYRAEAAVQIQSHTETNRPYAEYTYEDVTPTVKSCTPKSGFVDEKTDNLFGWSFAYNQTAVADTIKQKAYGFRWRAADASSWNEVTVQSGICSHTVEAGTFPERGSVQWCVRVQSDDGIWSEWSSVMELTTVDSIPTAGKLSPDKVYVDGSEENRFSWQHSIATGTKQSAYEAVFSIDEGESWQALSFGETWENGFLLPPGVLSSGEMLWRVRTANSDGVFGDWSESASLIVRAKPAVPVISKVDAVPMVQVFWQAAEQQGYEVVVGTESSGQRYGTEKSWQCPVWLADGEHPVKVRVCNRYGLWSDWAESTVSIRNVPVGHITLQSRTIGYEVVLRWQTQGEFLEYWILRDGTVIGRLTGNQYVDRESCGKSRYRIIGLQNDGHYTESNEVVEILRVKKAAVGRDGVWIPAHLNLDEPPEHRERRKAQLAYSYFWGEELPATQKGDGVSAEHQLSFVLQDPDHRKLLETWMGQRVIYKNPSGMCMKGILDSIDLKEKETQQVVLTIVEAKEWSDE